LEVAGDAELEGTLSLAGHRDAQDDVTIEKDLTVSMDTTLSADLDVSGGLDFHQPHSEASHLGNATSLAHQTRRASERRHHYRSSSRTGAGIRFRDSGRYAEDAWW
jgi:hypothetical protein